MKSSTSQSSLHPFGWCVVLFLISTVSWGQTSSESASASTDAQQAEELLLLEQENSAQQQNADRFQRAFEESPLGGAARRARTEELIRSHTEREPIVSYPGSGSFFDMQRGEALSPPPEEGAAPAAAADARRAREAAAREQREEEQSRRDRIYNACILDKSNDVDMSVVIVMRAVYATCKEISENPSWLERLWYD